MFVKKSLACFISIGLSRSGAKIAIASSRRCSTSSLVAVCTAASATMGTLSPLPAAARAPSALVPVGVCIAPPCMLDRKPAFRPVKNTGSPPSGL
eukprot:3340760-Prymnesium_polylepis.1